MQFVEVGQSGTGFCFSLEPLSSVQECNFRKSSLITYDTHPGMVINRNKFDVRVPSGFLGVN